MSEYLYWSRHLFLLQSMVDLRFEDRECIWHAPSGALPSTRRPVPSVPDLGISQASILKILAFRAGTRVRICYLQEGSSLLTDDHARRHGTTHSVWGYAFAPRDIALMAPHIVHCILQSVAMPCCKRSVVSLWHLDISGLRG
jgi:hypothetical protein